MPDGPDGPRLDVLVVEVERLLARALRAGEVADLRERRGEVVRVRGVLFVAGASGVGGGARA